MTPRGWAPLILMSVLGFGCGKGLTVDLTAAPNPALPGSSVTWNVSVRNDTQCDVLGEEIDLPAPFPTVVGIFTLFIGFDPTLGPGDPEEFCREFMMTDCLNQECLEDRFGNAFGPEVAARLSSRAQAAIQGAHEPQPAGTCETLFNDSEGYAGICAFEPLGPGASDSAMHTDTAPNTGNTNPAQVAIAFGFAEGEDCRPGTEVEEGLWIVAGCFPLARAEPAPLLSPLATAAGAVLLLGAGIIGVRRSRKS